MKKEVLASGKFLSFIRQDGYEMIERINCTGIVLVIAVNDENKLLLVEQHRPPVAKKVIELPAGLVGDQGAHKSEPFERAAKRELLEETGYEASELEELGCWPTTPGMSSELVTAFLARKVTRRHNGGGDEQEAITVHEVPLERAYDWLAKKQKAGLLVDPKIYAALFLLTQKAIAK